ncbi:MAG: hypothetical protein OWQ52_12910 [Metallosphaera prunae]|nr:hypothetical protein [Metallosphaera prunae]
MFVFTRLTPLRKQEYKILRMKSLKYVKSPENFSSIFPHHLDDWLKEKGSLDERS